MVGMRVEGGSVELGVIEAKLRTKRGRVGAQGSQVVRRSTLAGEAAAKAFAPVLTGHLKSSIGHEFRGDGRHGAMEGEWGPTAKYGHFVNNGTRYMAPQPFMDQSRDVVVPGFLAAVDAIGDPLD